MLPVTRPFLFEVGIQDFALVQVLRLELHPGLNVVTGETGAGKSIIIDALGAALGGRVDATTIRATANRAFVEALFTKTPDDPEARGQLSALGISEEPLILARDITPSRSLSRINGRTIPRPAVQALAERLVQIHAQADQLALLRPREHLDLLDRFAEVSGLRAAMATAAAALLAARRAIQALVDGERQAERAIAQIQRETSDIASAAFDLGEDDRLHTQLVRLANALKLTQLVNAARDVLRGEDERAGALDLLSEAIATIEQIRSVDPGCPVPASRLLDLLDAAEDADRALRAYGDSIDDDPLALSATEDRILLLADLKRRYGPTLADVAAYHATALAQLAALQDREHDLEALRHQEMAALADAENAAASLSAARARAALRLESAVEAELAELGMPGTRFAIALSRRPDPAGLLVDGSRLAFDESGVDQAEFTFSANPGEPPRPLVRIASGGELARLMLALHSILMQAHNIPVLVFDELEQGVGGRLGRVIGTKLWKLARHHQVLCVTHLAQVAAFADAHFVVTKASDGGRTSTAVRRADGQERVEELALLLAGPPVAAPALRNAEDLLLRVNEWKDAQIGERTVASPSA